jgi:hypothetical protein
LGQNLAIITEPDAPDARGRDAEFPKSTAWLLTHLPALDEMALVRKLSPLSSFLYEPHPSEYDPSWEEGDEVEEGAGVLRSFTPATALSTLDALIDTLATKPEEWRALVREGQSGGVVSDDDELGILRQELSEFRRCLSHVADRGAQFYLAIV